MFYEYTRQEESKEKYFSYFFYLKQSSIVYGVWNKKFNMSIHVAIVVINYTSFLFILITIFSYSKSKKNQVSARKTSNNMEKSARGGRQLLKDYLSSCLLNVNCLQLKLFHRQDWWFAALIVFFSHHWVEYWKNHLQSVEAQKKIIFFISCFVWKIV